MQQRPTLHAFVTRQNFRNSTMKMCGKCAEMKSDIKWKTFVQPKLFLLAGTFGFRRSIMVLSLSRLLSQLFIRRTNRETDLRL